MAEQPRFTRNRKPLAPDTSSEVLVIGLGRFGGAVARELTDLGFEVLGVDTDRRRVQRLSEVLTHALEADSTDVDVLEQIGARDFKNAVVGIGSDIEASVRPWVSAGASVSTMAKFWSSWNQSMMLPPTEWAIRRPISASG